MTSVTCRQCGAPFAASNDQAAFVGLCQKCAATRPTVTSGTPPVPPQAARPRPLPMSAGAASLVPPMATSAPAPVAAPQAAPRPQPIPQRPAAAPQPVPQPPQAVPQQPAPLSAAASATPSSSAPRPVPTSATPRPLLSPGAATAAAPAVRTDTELELNPFQRWVKMNLSMLSSAVVHLALILALGLFYVARPVKNLVELVATTSEETPVEPEEVAQVDVDLPEVALTPLVAEVNSASAFSQIDMPIDIAVPTEPDAEMQVATSSHLSEQIGQGIGTGLDNGVGSIGILNKRLEKAGAKTGDIQVSLMWNNTNDLDLYVRMPNGEVISFRHRQSRSGGMLDVDMNALVPTNEPVENIFWPKGRAPKGEYVVMVDYFANKGDPDPTKFGVAVRHDGQVKTFSGAIGFGEPPVVIYKFTR